MFGRKFLRQVGTMPLTFKRQMTVGTAKVVSIAEAAKMPRYYRDMDNDLLMTLSTSGDQEAREEVLIREIMSVRRLSWDEALPIFDSLVDANRKDLFLATIPYKVGITAALLGAFTAIPLVFHEPSVLAFNDLFVGAEVPEARDMETPLEVGSFAWNWMEPYMGTVSFFLLCCQFSRTQIENLAVKPYSHWYKARRANRMVENFPEYDAKILSAFSEGDPLSGHNPHENK